MNYYNKRTIASAGGGMWFCIVNFLLFPRHRGVDYRELAATGNLCGRTIVLLHMDIFGKKVYLEIWRKKLRLRFIFGGWFAQASSDWIIKARNKWNSKETKMNRICRATSIIVSEPIEEIWRSTMNL